MPESDFMCWLAGDLNPKLSFSTVMCHHSCGYLSMGPASWNPSYLVEIFMEKMYILWGEDSGNRARVNWRCPHLRDLGFHPPSCPTPSSVRPNNTSLKHTHEATAISLGLEDYPTNIMTTPPVMIYLSWRKQDSGAPEGDWVWDS